MKFSGIRVKPLRLFLLQNNSVTFCSYLPFLPRPSLSPQPLLCARLSALCACISERRRRRRTRVDLALVQEVYMLCDYNAPLQTQYGAGGERERLATHKAKLAVFVSCSLRLSPILCVPLWSAVRKHFIIKHCIGGDTPALCFSVSIYVRERLQERSERERHNDNAASSDNVLRH